MKIGWATDLPVRLSGIQSACPYKIKLLGSIEAPRAAEKRLHRFFGQHCIHHEWFNPHPSLLEFIERIKVDGFPPWVVEHVAPSERGAATEELKQIVRRSAEPAVAGEKIKDQIARAAERLDITFTQAWRCWHGKAGGRAYPMVKRKFDALMNGSAMQ